MGFFNVARAYDWVKVDFSDGLGETDDGFKLTNCYGNSVGLLRYPLVFGRLSVSHIQVLKHLTSLLRKFWLQLLLGIANVLSEHIQRDLTLLLLVLGMHVQIENMGSDLLIQSVLSDVLHDENGIESRQN